MLGKVTQRLVSTLVVSMSISALPVFSLAASADVKESSNTEISSVDKSSIKDNNDKGTQTGANSETQETGKAPAIIMDKTPIEPTKVFDNLYFVGTKGVGAWVLNTSDGIILIDSMNRSEDAENTIIPGIKKLGFDPADIKYILVTHGHGDHYGGAKYIAENYGSTVLMSAVDWEYMNTHFTYQCSPEFPKPTSHTDITDGEKLTLGDTTITIVSTPGHSPGGVSLVIPVTDNGTKHTVSMWGGTGLPRTLEDSQAYLNSLNHFAEFTDAAQVDAEITAHTAVDNSAERMEILRNRKDGDPNPFVIGQDAYKAYMDKMKTSINANIEKLSKETQTNQSQAAATKGWTKNSAGKWVYSDSSNSLATATWKQIGDKWYYFDSSSEAVTGWKEINGQWYYFDESCAMVHDCYIGGYYLTSSGAMN
jgi:metallo-beta-lactamase class B